MNTYTAPAAASIGFDEIQSHPQLQNWTYFYVVHGVIPEVMPCVAYRRVGAEEQHERKILKCPFCKSRLTDTDASTKVELFAHSKRVKVKCQVYLRCVTCRSEVGIKMV